MFCGFLSIISASEGNYNYAAWLIIVAAIFDALDGLVARLTNSSSELGVELDSLSKSVIGDSGAYRSSLYQNLYSNKFDTQQAKIGYQQNKLYEQKLAEENKAYAPYTSGTPFSSFAPGEDRTTGTTGIGDLTGASEAAKSISTDTEKKTITNVNPVDTSGSALKNTPVSGGEMIYNAATGQNVSKASLPANWIL